MKVRSVLRAASVDTGRHFEYCDRLDVCIASGNAIATALIVFCFLAFFNATGALLRAWSCYRCHNSVPWWQWVLGCCWFSLPQGIAHAHEQRLFLPQCVAHTSRPPEQCLTVAHDCGGGKFSCLQSAHFRVTRHCLVVVYDCSIAAQISGLIFFLLCIVPASNSRNTASYKFSDWTAANESWKVRPSGWKIMSWLTNLSSSFCFCRKTY